LGPRAIEVYLPLQAGTPVHTVGALELYLSDAPIDHDVSGMLSTLYRDLVLGLGVLYLVLFAITASVSGRLRREAERNAFLADHDPLTALPNRTSFQRRAASALAEARRTGVPAAVAIIDLDRFKAINDTLGHPNGDAVLRELARWLTDELGDAAFVARLGGDEYGVVLPDGTRAAPTLRRLRAALGREVSVAGLTLAVEASIGFVLAPADGAHADILLQRADVAMYAAKEQHTGVARYEPVMERHDAAGLSLVAELPHAIDDDQLVLHYQPLEQLRSGRVIAIEALVRWQHPVHGLLFPDRFLGLAEQTDVIDRLTRWVLRRALRDCRQLSPLRGGPRVAVNVSARSIGRGALADEVIAALTELDIEPDRLIIEVTETAILADPARAATELRRLSDAGVKISLDDFGQGQTSISHLSTLPLHELKIDRAFVGDMDIDPAHAAIVRSMVELGHNLGLQVVAEGVETEQVREQLRGAGSDLLQGYLLSRPLPREQLVEWLAARAPRSSEAPAALTA
jgi:diguanylate cyclase (GGDEF)-like protein